MKKKSIKIDQVKTGFDLRKWRQCAGYSREQVAVGIGKSLSTLYRYEKDNITLGNDFLILLNTVF